MSEIKVITRRTLLGAFAGLLSGCDSAPGQSFLKGMDRWNGRVQGGLLSPDRLARDPGEAAITGGGEFPVYFISPQMPTPPALWALRVRGLVERPMDFSLEDLKRMTRTDIRVRHHCVEGWSAVASWHGVQLREFARIVGADPRAEFVEFRSFDSNYHSSWDRESVFHPQTILAYGMNGASLGADHGGPARLYGGIKLGYKNVKYLSEITFMTQPTGGYWENLGYEWFAGT